MPDINWEVFIKIASSSVTPIITAVIGYLKSEGAPVNLIRKEAEIIGVLPESSNARAKLDELLTKHIEALAEQDGYKRNIPMFVVALVMTPAMILLTMHIASLGDWWWILATATGFLALAFLCGIFDSIQLAPRNKNGTQRDKNAYSWLSSSMVWLGVHWPTRHLRISLD